MVEPRGLHLLGKGNHVRGRRQAPGLVRPHVPRRPDPCLDLVDDQQRPVPLDNRLQPPEERRGRVPVPALALLKRCATMLGQCHIAHPALSIRNRAFLHKSRHRRTKALLMLTRNVASDTIMISAHTWMGSTMTPATGLCHSDMMRSTSARHRSSSALHRADKPVYIHAWATRLFLIVDESKARRRGGGGHACSRLRAARSGT